MKVKSESEVAQSCPTLNDLMDCSLPGSSVHGIFQARVLEWDAIAFSVNKIEKTLIVCSKEYYFIGCTTEAYYWEVEKGLKFHCLPISPASCHL